jgi:hypothetical protein
MHHQPVMRNKNLFGKYMHRDIPKVDVTSVVIYGRDPSGSVIKLEEFQFPAITMKDGDGLTITTKLDTHFGIADISDIVWQQTAVDNDERLSVETTQFMDGELEERITHWRGRL